MEKLKRNYENWKKKVIYSVFLMKSNFSRKKFQTIACKTIVKTFANKVNFEENLKIVYFKYLKILIFFNFLIKIQQKLQFYIISCLMNLFLAQKKPSLIFSDSFFIIIFPIFTDWELKSSSNSEFLKNCFKNENFEKKSNSYKHFFILIQQKLKFWFEFKPKVTKAIKVSQFLYFSHFFIKSSRSIQIQNLWKIVA